MLIRRMLMAATCVIAGVLGTAGFTIAATAPAVAQSAVTWTYMGRDVSTGQYAYFNGQSGWAFFPSFRGNSFQTGTQAQ